MVEQGGELIPGGRTVGEAEPTGDERFPEDHIRRSAGLKPALARHGIAGMVREPFRGMGEASKGQDRLGDRPGLDRVEMLGYGKGGGMNALGLVEGVKGMQYGSMGGNKVGQDGLRRLATLEAFINFCRLNDDGLLHLFQPRLLLNRFGTETLEMQLPAGPSLLDPALLWVCDVTGTRGHGQDLLMIIRSGKTVTGWAPVFNPAINHPGR